MASGRRSAAARDGAIAPRRFPMQAARVLLPAVSMLRPDPPSSLGNPPPPFAETLDLPEEPPRRVGRRADIGRSSAGIDLGGLRRILVVKLDFIGDWVLTTPFLAGLRQAAPEAEITALVLDRVFDLAAPCRFLDRVVAVPAAASGPVRFAAGSAADLAAFLADWRGAAFDLALVPRWDTDYNGATRIAGLSGAPTVIGFSEYCTARKQIENAGFDRHLDLALLDRRQCHEIEHMLGFLAALGGPRHTRLHLDLTPADRQAAANFRAAELGGKPRPLLAVAPFAAGRRQWPLDRTAWLAAELAGRLDMAVAVIGGPGNIAEARSLAARVSETGVQAAASAGLLRLGGNAALIGEAALLLGMDSGPGHIAAACGVPVVILSGHPPGASPAHPGAPERFGPWGKDDRILLVRTPVHRPPCVDGCEADEPHCILGLEREDALRLTESFARQALDRQPSQDPRNL